MHAFLLSIGVLAIAIGMFIIGFGIPINDFSFGNTLIIAGTVSVTGGLILSELRRRCASFDAWRTPLEDDRQCGALSRRTCWLRVLAFVLVLQWRVDHKNQILKMQAASQRRWSLGCRQSLRTMEPRRNCRPGGQGRTFFH